MPKIILKMISLKKEGIEYKRITSRKLILKEKHIQIRFIGCEDYFPRYINTGMSTTVFAQYNISFYPYITN